MMKIILILITFYLITVNLFSQIQYSSPSIFQNIIQNLSGPRMGLTIISNGDLTELYLMNLV